MNEVEASAGHIIMLLGMAIHQTMPEDECFLGGGCLVRWMEPRDSERIKAYIFHVWLCLDQLRPVSVGLQFPL